MQTCTQYMPIGSKASGFPWMLVVSFHFSMRPGLNPGNMQQSKFEVWVQQQPPMGLSDCSFDASAPHSGACAQQHPFAQAEQAPAQTLTWGATDQGRPVRGAHVRAVLNLSLCVRVKHLHLISAHMASHGAHPILPVMTDILQISSPPFSLCQWSPELRQVRHPWGPCHH